MSTERTIQVEVSDEVAEYIHRQVETGGFADEGAVVTHALEEARDADEAMERWLREEVRPVAERVLSEGAAGLTAEEVFGEARDRYLARARR
jgi:antitoxin ParD1/3/4